MDDPALTAIQYGNLFKGGDSSVTSLRSVHLFSLFWILVYGAAILQNYLGTAFNNASFYLSESILFNTFWLFFIPLSGLSFRIYQHLILPHNRRSPVWKICLISSFVLGSVHLILFSAAIFLISGLLLHHTFEFYRMINETFTEDYYLVFSVYGLITFLIVWSHHFKEKVDQLENGSARYIDKLSIREGKTLIPVETNRIQWIDTDHPYIAIHTPEKTYLYSSNLRDVLKKLNPDQFVRIHRSTIVNLDYVSELTSRLTGDYDIKMKDGTELRLSRNYSRDVKNKLEQ